MTPLEAALVEIVTLLEELRLPYMLIGGLAVAQWGEPRATLDIDFTVWVEPENFESTVERLAARLTVRAPEPLEFTKRTRVMPARSANGTPVDLVFAAFPMERRAIQRAVDRRVAGSPVRVAALEDLLFLKLISGRPRDIADASALFRRHRTSLDLARLEREIAELALAIAQPEMLERFRRLVQGE